MLLFAFFHHPAEPFHHVRVGVGEEGGLLFVKPRDDCHILVRQCEVEYVEVFLHALNMCRCYDRNI